MSRNGLSFNHAQAIECILDALDLILSGAMVPPSLSAIRRSLSTSAA